MNYNILLEYRLKMIIIANNLCLPVICITLHLRYFDLKKIDNHESEITFFSELCCQFGIEYIYFEHSTFHFRSPTI